MLRAAARAVADTCRDGDLLARYGGEEFAVILDGADEAAARAAAERIRRVIRAADTPVPVTASLGVAVFGVHSRDVTGLIAAADAALYEAKRGGRDRVEVSGGEAAPVAA